MNVYYARGVDLLEYKLISWLYEAFLSSEIIDL